jgi:hypothetical protein
MMTNFSRCRTQVIDTSDGDGGAVTEIVEVIVSALQKNMSSLEFAFRFFDQKGLGYVSTDGAAPYTPHPTPCTLHPTPCTLHPTPYNLHPDGACRPLQGYLTHKKTPPPRTLL